MAIHFRLATKRPPAGTVPREMFAVHLAPPVLEDAPVLRVVRNDADDEEVLARMRARPNLLTGRGARRAWPGSETERIGEGAPARS